MKCIVCRVAYPNHDPACPEIREIKPSVETQLIQQMTKHKVSDPTKLPLKELAILRLRAAADALESGEAIINEFEHEIDHSSSNRFWFKFDIQQK